MAVHNSPGAYHREIDQSLYVETTTNTVLGIVHTFNKGLINERTLVTGLASLETLFGSPIDASVSSTACQGWFAAREYLRRGNKLYITRVESSAQPAAYAAQSLQGSTDQYVVTGTDGATSVPSTKTLTSATGDFVNDGVLVGDILEVHEGGADDGFYVLTNVTATVLTVDRDWPTGSLSNQDFTVWTSKVESGSDGATSASSSRELTSALATFQTNGVAAGDILEIADSGDTEDNGVYLISSVDSETQLTIDRDWPSGSLTGLTYTVYGPLASASDGATATAGEFSSAGAKFQDHGVQAGDILYINDAVDTGNNGYHMITGLKSGSEDTTLEVNTVAWSGGSLSGLTYKVLPGSVTLQGATKGTWCSGLYIKPIVNAGDSQNFNLQVKDSSNSLTLETVYNMDRSNVVSEMSSNSSYFTATLRSNRGEPVPGTAFTVSGGDDGYTSIADSDYIGNSALESGLYSFKNPELVDIDLLICPGQYSQNVQDALINLCEARQDCMAILDPPDWSVIDSVQEILDYHNGLNTRTTALNTSYAALYWTWVKVYDEYHDQDVWTAPSGHIAGVYTHNDNVQAPWFAPAGLKRAKLIGASDVRYSPSVDDRDSLYSSGQNVNSIVKFPVDGIHVWGQKTLQRASTALDRVNVRRMLLNCKKAITKASRQLVFDPNDATLWREFKSLANPKLRDVLSRRGINDFLIVADESTTTATVAEQNKMIGKVFIKPTKAAEVIELQFIITSQGADFSELVA